MTASPATMVSTAFSNLEIGERARVMPSMCFANFGQLQAAIEQRKLPLISAQSEYVAQNPISLPEEKANEVLALIDELEQDEDVQNVFHNLS